MSARKKVNNALSFKDKIDVINDSNNLSVKQLCEKYRCGKTQVYSILKNRNKIFNEFCKGERSPNSKRQSRCPYEEINKILYKWYINAQSNNHPVTGPILQEQAKLIAAKLGNTTFKASNGWLDSFRTRHSISFNKDVYLNVDVETNHEWKHFISTMSDSYKPENIGCCGKFGLFFRALPSDVMTLKNKKCYRGEKSRTRLTILICGFADGTLEKPLVVGKSLAPNPDVTSLLVDWRVNSKSFMTSQLMVRWLHNLNERMKTENRNVLLFFNKATCHPSTQFSNIKIVFLPVYQMNPMDLGVIKRIKIHYRKQMMQFILANMEPKISISELTRKITLLDALRWLKGSYEEITRSNVMKSFEKAGFPACVVKDSNNCESISSELNDLTVLLKKAGNELPNAEDYINIDSELSVEEEFQTLAEIFKAESVRTESDDDDQEVLNVNVENTIKSFSEALNYINQLEKFANHINSSLIQEQLLKLKSAIEFEAALRK